MASKGRPSGRKASDKVKIRSRMFVGMLAVLGASLSGCVGEASDAPEQSSEATQPILGATPAVGNKYRAVGALVEGIPDPDYGFLVWNAFCSATLVGPNKLVTARHCTQFIDNPTYPEFGVYFAVGDNAYLAEQYIQVTGYTAAPAVAKKGGLLKDGGRDVAVMDLESKPVNVVPAKIGRFQKHMLGQKFELIGIGRNDDSDDGARYAGFARARQMHGLWYPALFDHNRWEYWNWYWTDAQTSSPSWKQGREWWHSYKLEPGYELLIGGDEGEALNCYGDSGGPMVRGHNAHNLTVYGVGFASESSKSRICDKGSAYLVFHKNDIWRFLQKAL